MTVSFCVGPRQPRSPSPSYRGRPAIIFGSAFVVPAVAETEQGSPAHGQPDLHRDRFECTACLARSSSPPGPTTQSCATGDFLKVYERPRIGGDLCDRSVTETARYGRPVVSAPFFFAPES